jgi:hypothetical protein
VLEPERLADPELVVELAVALELAITPPLF